MIIHFDHALNSVLKRAENRCFDRLDGGIYDLLEENAITGSDDLIMGIFDLKRKEKEVTMVSPNHEGAWLFKGNPKQVQKRILALVNRALKKQQKEE